MITGSYALPVIISRSKASASHMPMARICNLSLISVSPTQHKMPRRVTTTWTGTFLNLNQCGRQWPVSVSCQLVIAPKPSLLWDPYLLQLRKIEAIVNSCVPQRGRFQSKGSKIWDEESFVYWETKTSYRTRLFYSRLYTRESMVKVWKAYGVCM